MPDMLIAIVIGCFGLLIGSFLNVCIYRLPRKSRVAPEDLRDITPEPDTLWQKLQEKGYVDEEAMIMPAFWALPDAQALDIADADAALKERLWQCFRAASAISVFRPPRSFCPQCKARIAWYDNIPVLSYLVLTGRCRRCKQSIPARYVGVELLTAALLVMFYYWFGVTPDFFVFSLLGCALIVATFIDFEFYIIPDEITLGGLLVGVVLSMLFPALHDRAGPLAALGQSLLGALAGGGSIYLIGKFGELVFRKESMGGGDVKFMAMIGAVLGWQAALLIFFLAPFFGALVGIIARLRRGAEVIPYGPYLSLATLLTMLFGKRILAMLFWLY